MYASFNVSKFSFMKPCQNQYLYSKDKNKQCHRIQSYWRHYANMTLFAVYLLRQQLVSYEEIVFNFIRENNFALSLESSFR